MDKFDQQIVMLKATKGLAKLDEKQFMNKLIEAQRAKLQRRILMGAMGLSALATIAGTLHRNMLNLLFLTLRYFGELPSTFTEYSHAYATTISWPSMISIVCLVVLSVLLVRSRDLTVKHSKHAYQYASTLAALAVALGITGLAGSPTQAHANQAILERTLNQHGHLEVRVDGANYELYAKSSASDDSIRSQAFIENLRRFDISKAYSKYQNMDHGGLVAEVRAVNTKDDCIYYVERRLEPTLSTVVDADSGCIRGSNSLSYLDQQLQPLGTPKWKVGQAFYLTHAYTKGTSKDTNGSPVGIVILLAGKADQYVAANNNDKLVPKGEPGTGVESCGANQQDLCPQTASIDIFTNAKGKVARGEIGSSVADGSLQPQSGSTETEFFAKIVADDDQSLQLVTDSGKQLTIHWSQNVIAEFNGQGARNYQTAAGILQVSPGDHLIIRIAYVGNMDLQNLSLSDIYSISVALKPVQPDPLSGQTYSKDKAMQQIQKY